MKLYPRKVIYPMSQFYKKHHVPKTQKNLMLYEMVKFQMVNHQVKQIWHFVPCLLSGVAKTLNRWTGFFRRSKLMRDKWDRSQSGTTYGSLTLEKAAATVSNIYSLISAISADEAFTGDIDRPTHHERRSCYGNYH